MSSEIFLRKLTGWSELNDGLARLDRLTNEGARMASGEVQRIANENVRGLGDRINNVDETVLVVGGDIQIASHDFINVVDDRMQRAVDGTPTQSVSQQLHR